MTGSFHAHHAPMGAHSSFTVGMLGAPGGMAMEMGRPADQAVFVGYRTASGVLYCLPFFEPAPHEAERYRQSDPPTVGDTVVFGDDEITREYRWATDRFVGPGVSLTIATPFFSIPDPKTADAVDLQFACCPATFLTLTIENTSDEAWEGFFGMQSDTPWAPLSQAATDGWKGAMTRERMGFATCDDAEEFMHFSVSDALRRDHLTPNFLLGSVAGLSVRVGAGETRTLDVVLGYYRGDQATYNHPARYFYTRYFSGLQDVFSYAWEHRHRYLAEAADRDAELAASPLTDAQKFLIAHATRSYYGSTEWLTDGRPLWVVNEGEYLMMNTLDLTVDMVFFEMRFNPWTVRNVLEQFVERYSYTDEICAPGEPKTRYPGGLSFTHDMGVANHFSPPGSSSYECRGLDRECFSYMTCEQLTNWVLCAGVYIAGTGDREFLEAQRDTFAACLESLLRRDHPDPDRRNGLMGFDSSRTEGGGEITTYDSLDHSLGQARHNVYLGGKCWASYLALEYIFALLNASDAAAEARQAAGRCAGSLTAAFDDDLGILPAVADGTSRSAIIPAVEALVYPWEMGLRTAVADDGPYGGYIRVLKRHLATVLQPGVCLYPDGGWKLSSSADNSWMSKICLNQYVLREVLGLRYDGEDRADRAHMRWEVEGAKGHACSDQFASGRPIGSRYYPRIVTSILWMHESRQDHTPLAPTSRQDATSPLARLTPA